PSPRLRARSAPHSFLAAMLTRCRLGWRGTESIRRLPRDGDLRTSGPPGRATGRATGRSRRQPGLRVLAQPGHGPAAAAPYPDADSDTHAGPETGAQAEAGAPADRDRRVTPRPDYRGEDRQRGCGAAPGRAEPGRRGVCRAGRGRPDPA